MFNKLKKILRENKFLGKPYLILQHWYSNIKLQFKNIKNYFKYKARIKTAKKYNRNIFYLGIPAHNNLGDLAQGVCIREWLNQHYSKINIIEVETDAIVNTNLSVLKFFKNVFNVDKDIIVFQSGYTPTDLGGHADELHRTIIKCFPKAKIIMMPQTIYFVDKNNEKRTSEIYNSAENMLFLARDRVSYEMAQRMFPDIKTAIYPDIVTTLIGSKKYKNSREGIMMCCRNDGEKFYSDCEMNELKSKLSLLCRVDMGDTTKNIKTSEIVNKAEYYIKKEIEEYSKYKLIITDRYHGTIFSLIASTPVIVIKTTDHKVITGTEWFRGVYDDYVYFSKNLDEAYETAVKLLNKIDYQALKPYFKEKYYDNLHMLFDESGGNGE